MLHSHTCQIHGSEVVFPELRRINLFSSKSWQRKSVLFDSLVSAHGATRITPLSLDISALALEYETSGKAIDFVCSVLELSPDTPFSEWGLDALKLFEIAVSLFKLRGGILVIDELESCIHQHFYEALWAHLYHEAQHYGVQLFIGTNSVDLFTHFGQYFDVETPDATFYRLGVSARTSNYGAVIATGFWEQAEMSSFANPEWGGRFM